MNKQDKELLLKDLCARLPYGVKAHIINDGFYDVRDPYDTLLDIPNHHLVMDLNTDNGLIIQPYLRSMSSIGEEERKEYEQWLPDGYNVNTFDWLNAHHFDYRGLIPKGLALEASEDMYKTE